MAIPTLRTTWRAKQIGACVLLATLGGFGGTLDARAQDGSPKPGDASAEVFRAHMLHLADDALQGRETGTEGYLMAANYVASQFEELGLAPLGERGFFREVSFLSTRLQPDSTELVVHRGAETWVLVFGEDYVMSGSLSATDESVTAPLVFVGYGIVAAQHGHDDFAGVDTRKKILVRLTGSPPGFPPDERAFYSSTRVKDRLATEHGAVGVFTIRTPADLPRLTWRRYLDSVGSSDMAWTGSDGRPNESFPQLKGVAVLSEAAAQRLFTLAGRTLDDQFESHAEGETGGFALGVEATLRRRSVHQKISAPNVVGLIPGSDPGFAGEYVLFTAHLDHLGVRRGEEGDDIYNGAYDNAAGVATILEVARIMARQPGLVRRSVVFAALTGEEQGLQGSSYLARYPPLPIEGLTAVINIDMPYLGFPIAEIMGLGVEHSTLQAALERAAEGAGLAYIADPRPELVRFIRSDQFSFVQRGVPGLNLKPGAESSQAAVDGAAMHGAFLSDHYHRPSDDLELPFSPAASERFTRVAVLLGLDVANADQRPQWNPDDFFGLRFGSAGTKQ